MQIPKRLSFAYFLGSAALVLASQASLGADLGNSADASAAQAAMGAATTIPTDTATVSADVSTNHLSVRDRATSLVENALGFIGVKYRRGGTEPQTGFDCSGLVRYVFHDAWGMDLPHRAEQISHLGERIGKDELKPGDLVFYSTLKKTVSHVGIYLGEGQFIHAPSRGEKVRVEDMNQPYWIKRFSGARRVSQDDVKAQE